MFFTVYGSLRYGNEYCIEDAVWEKLIFSSSTEAFFNHAVELHVHWFVQCYKNASSLHLRFLRKKRLRHAAHSMARNAVLVPISQKTEVTIVTNYVPFRYFTRTAS